jgi:hypothetical protein
MIIILSRQDDFCRDADLEMSVRLHISITFRLTDLIPECFIRANPRSAERFNAQR